MIKYCSFRVCMVYLDSNEEYSYFIRFVVIPMQIVTNNILIFYL